MTAYATATAIVYPHVSRIDVPGAPGAWAHPPYDEVEQLIGIDPADLEARGILAMNRFYALGGSALAYVSLAGAGSGEHFCYSLFTCTRATFEGVQYQSNFIRSFFYKAADEYELRVNAAAARARAKTYLNLTAGPAARGFYLDQQIAGAKHGRAFMGMVTVHRGATA
jgi:hypothetical protein